MSSFFKRHLPGIILFLGLIVLTLATIASLSKPVSAAECGGWLQQPCQNSDTNVAADLEKLVAQGDRVVGMPSIVNFFEKQMVRQLYEMRDDPTYRTFSYIVNMQGDFIFLCDSIGYGINASIQFSNPQKPVDLEDLLGRVEGNSQNLMPQAEPNALFMPEGLAATYIMCLDPTTLESAQPKLVPIYVEPNVIVSPFKMGAHSE